MMHRNRIASACLLVIALCVIVGFASLTLTANASSDLYDPRAYKAIHVPLGPGRARYPQSLILYCEQFLAISQEAYPDDPSSQRALPASTVLQELIVVQARRKAALSPFWVNSHISLSNTPAIAWSLGGHAPPL